MLFLFITKLFLALLALLVLALGMFGVLRVFDWILGVNFKHSMGIMAQTPIALAIYYGLRMLGMSIAVGGLVCFCLIL